MDIEARKINGRKGGSAKTGGVKARGFASMSPERHKELSSKGGKRSKNPYGRRGKDESNQDQPIQ